MVAASPTGGPRGTTAALAALLVLAGMTAVPAAGHANPQAGGSPFAATATQIDADAVLLEVALQPDGTAAWRVEYRVRLDDANTTAAFEALSEDVAANGSAYVARFEERMAPTVRDAAARTGREMALQGVEVTTTTVQLPQTYGVLAYTFQWTGFAAVEDGHLRAGDALAGLFLDADTTLLVSWPEGSTLTTVSPTPTEQRERSVLWRGPVDFAPGEPSIVVAVGGGPAGPEASLVGVGVVLVVLLAGGALWWRRRRRGATDRPPAGPAADAEPAVADELLSNEERVIALLEAHGGRMKQQAIVEELGWTEAKTSQVVGRLRDAGRVEGFRLGRENVLRLPAVDDRPDGEVTAGADERRRS